MLRMILTAVLIVVVAASASLAEQVTGKLDKIGDDKIIVKVRDRVTKEFKDRNFQLTRDTKVVDAAGKPADGGLKALKEGSPVTVIFETKDGKDVVTEIKSSARKRERP